MPDRLRSILAGLVLSASALWFLNQSFFKEGFLWDFGVYDASSRAWLTGHNPYDAQGIWTWWLHCGIWPRFSNDISGLPPVSPPLGLVIFAPIAALPPTISACVWLVLSIGLLILEFIALLRLAQLPAFSTAGMLMMSSILLMSPLRISFLTGQSAGPAASLIILAVWAAREDRQRTAGILLAAAAALKLQLALPFVVIYAFIGRPRITLTGLSAIALLLAVALIGLHAGGSDWFASWRSSLASVSSRGGLNDFDASNIYNYELLNLQLPIGAVIASRELTNALSIFIVAGTTLLFLTLLITRPSSNPTDTRSAGQGRDDLLIAAILAPLLLLPVYHRYYDGVILALPIAWTFRELTRKHPAIPCLVGLLLLLSMVTPHSIVPRLSQRFQDRHMDSVVTSVWYNALVVPHRVWLVGLITAAMLYEMSRQGGKNGNQSSGEPI